MIQRQGNEIICVSLQSDAPLLGLPRVFIIADSAPIVRKVVNEALLRLLTQQGYSFLDFDPPTFVARRPMRDIVPKVVPASQLGKVGWLHVYPQYQVASRVLYPRSNRPQHGVLIDFHARHEIDLSVAELSKLGVEVRGRFVRSVRQSSHAPNPLRDPASELFLVGKVVDIRGTTLLLTDARDKTEIAADQAWLEARPDVFDACLQHLGLPAVEGVLLRLEQEIFNLTGAKGRLARIEDLADGLARQGDIQVAEDLTCRFTELLTSREGTDSGMYRKFPAPQFFFDPARTKSSGSYDRGLEEFGPFDAESFPTKRPRIVVITPQEYRGDVEVFLRRFKEGMPQAKAFTQGFVRKYHLNDCAIQFYTFDREIKEAASYKGACLQALNQTPKPDLAFVITSEQHKHLPEPEDPYLVSKSALMAQGVPVQGIEIETIQVPSNLAAGVPYTLNSLGLACYAKLGGTPFVIASSPGLAEELVIGIGSASHRSGRLSRVERLVGITTVFSADGNYLLHNTSRETTFEDYPEELLNTLESTIEQVRKRNGWQPGQQVRLVFHVFKPLKDVEAQAVKELVNRLDDFEVQFAFLHLSEHHNWYLFDKNQGGREDYSSQDPRLRGKKKGEYVPDRGYAVSLGRREMLLTVTGPLQLSTALHGAPHPLLINLHRESTFNSLDYLAQQVFRFTSISWRNFYPTSKPVTILYSDLIADLLGRLRHVPNWNPDVLRTSLRLSRWFL